MMGTHTYKNVGELALRADVYGADAQAGPPRPAIIWIHGGALIMGSRSGIRPDQLERYLDAGFVVFAIDYRLAPETQLPGILEDIQDAFRWVRTVGGDAFGVDPDRLGVVGHSAGGYLTLLSGHRVHPAPKALVSFYGYGDIIGDWYSRPDPFYNTFERVTEVEAHRSVGERELTDGASNPRRRNYYLWCRQNGLWSSKVGGRDPATEPNWFTQYCPAENVGGESPEYPPTLLLHGDADTDVPYPQSVHMERRLVEAGIEHKLITIPGGPHGFDRSPDGADGSDVAEALDTVVRFLSKYV